MTIPLWALLIPYGLVAALFVIFSFFNLYHLIRFGFITFGSALFFLIYLGASAIILMVTWSSLQGIDWSMPFFSFQNGVGIEDRFFGSSL